MKKIAVMGGSFDPCHIGHINLALDAKRQYNLDEVILVPARLQPFKVDKKSLPGHMRLEMLQAASSDFGGLRASNIELLRRGMSYTYDTMREIKNSLDKDTELYFLLGTDAFLNIEKWEKAEDLLKENHFLIGSRPGYREDELDEAINRISSKYSNLIMKVDNKKYHISSTEIRKNLEDGLPISHLVSPPVDRYIREHKIYTSQFAGRKNYFRYKDVSENVEISLEDISKTLTKYIENHISDRRKRHIEGVLKLSLDLGKHYKVDLMMLKVAALGHDIAKELPMYELNDLIELYEIDEKYINKPNLSHSKVGAALIKDCFNINDEIVNMISYHTTGRESMPLEEKIIFIADMVEENRCFDGVEDIRKWIFKDLDMACYLALKHTLSYLSRKNAYIDDDSNKALKWFEKAVKGGLNGN